MSGRRVVDISVRVVLVLAVLFTGLGAALVMAGRSQHSAEVSRQELATRATIDIRATTRQIVASLSGVAALVRDDGRIDQQTFDAFATGTLAHTPLSALGYERVVPESERMAFEAEIGRPIHRGATTGYSPSAPADQYFAVRFVSPLSATTRSLIGYDIRSEPVRAAAALAARDTGMLQLTRPVRSQTTNVVSVFIVQPLYRPGVPVRTVAERRAAIVGFVTTAFAGSGYLDAARRSFPAGASVEIRDGDDVVAQTTTPVAHRSVARTDNGGRIWTVAVDDHKRADQTAARTLTVGSILLASALAAWFLSAARGDATIRRGASRSQRLAQLGEAIAAAESGEAVARVIVRRAGDVMDAMSTELAIIGPRSNIVLVRRSDSNGNGNGNDGGNANEKRITAGDPLSDAILERRPVLIGDRAALRAAYPSDAAGFESRKVRAIAALPMFSTASTVIGAIGFEWSRPVVFDDSTTALLLTLADIGEQTIERSRASDFRIGSALRMAELARELTAARTIEEIVGAINDKVPPAVDSAMATIALVENDRRVVRLALPIRERDRMAAARALDEQARVGAASAEVGDPFLELGFDLLAPVLDPLRRAEPLLLDRHSLERFPKLRDALLQRDLHTIALLPMAGIGSDLTSVLIVAWATEIGFNVVLSAQLGTIRDLCEQTTERVRLYTSEHHVVVQLQARTLAPFPTVDGLDLAGRYQPASADVGMGGDWYDAFDTGSSVCIVIGDVTGHGIQAVADMTQLRTSISALLRSGLEVAKVFGTVTEMIGNDPAEVRMATAACLEIDPSKRRAHYTSAGHPPMLVRAPDGRATEIGSATQPPIGVPGIAGPGIDLELATGSVIVAYTDGLIERRDEPIDSGIERLRLALEAAEGDVDAIADHLLATCIGNRPTDDDVALVVVRIE